MKKHIYLVVLCLFLGGGSYAQETMKRKMTTEELLFGVQTSSQTKTPRNLQWLGEKVIYQADSTLVMVNPETGDEQELLKLAQLRTLMPQEQAEIKKMPYFFSLGAEKNNLTFIESNHLYVLDPISVKLQAHYDLSGVSIYKLSRDQRKLAFVHDHDLYIKTSDSGDEVKALRITQDGSDKIVYGDAVHQREFGIEEGLFWSPDNKKLAFYRMDQSMVKPYPMVTYYADHKADAEPHYYPMAGEPSHHVTIGIYDLETGKLSYLKTDGDKERYFTNLSWSPDSKSLYVAEVNRAQNHCELRRYSAIKGEYERTLIVEDDPHYVEPLHPIMFVLGASDKFIWVSRRNGYRHLYLYNTSGKLLSQLTQGAWEVQQPLGFDSKGQNFFYTSTVLSPLDRHTSKVNLKSRKSLILDKTSGWHHTQISPSGSYYLDRIESYTIAARDIIGRTKDGKSLVQINEAPNLDQEYATPRIDVGTLKAADGKTDLYYKIIKPYDFDANKKYPVIIYVYNGPHAQLVQNRRRMGSLPWSLDAANHGFIVFTVDGRGSDARGAQFEQVIHRELGKNEVADQMEGVKFLKSLPYVDSDRIGVYGWSFGGFMATSLMLAHPEVFKVAVAGGAVTNWQLYEIMYGERYMDSPQENPAGYEATNLILRAKDLKGRLLMIHGANDPVVVWQHSLAFVKAVVDHGGLIDYMVYPGHLHNVRGRDRAQLNKTILRYFEDHLK